MEKASFALCDSYEEPGLEAAVRRAAELAGGIEDLIKPGDRVLIKPNMLSAHPPDRCITTHPGVVKAVGRMVLDLGARPFIGDSPALDGFRRTAAKSGLAEAAEALGVSIGPLTDSIRTACPEGSFYKSLELAREALEADVVLNLPKLKTHCQMLLTLGVKNMFGTVVSQRKAEWHLAAGLNRETFASLLIDIYLTTAPALTIMDGVWGMEGRGPGNGRPKFVGFLAASRDALGLDLEICRILGVPLKKFPLFRAAVTRGMIASDSQFAEIVGDRVEALSDFEIPDLETLLMGGFWGRLMGRHLVSKPVQNPELCVACRKCVEICAAKAIDLDERRLKFDYDRCIRCYCCQEVCPQDAIDFRTGWLGRVLGLIGR